MRLVNWPAPTSNTVNMAGHLHRQSQLVSESGKPAEHITPSAVKTQRQKNTASQAAAGLASNSDRNPAETACRVGFGGQAECRLDPSMLLVAADCCRMLAAVAHAAVAQVGHNANAKQLVATVAATAAEATVSARVQRSGAVMVAALAARRPAADRASRRSLELAAAAVVGHTAAAAAATLLYWRWPSGACSAAARAATAAAAAVGTAAAVAAAAVAVVTMPAALQASDMSAARRCCRAQPPAAALAANQAAPERPAAAAAAAAPAVVHMAAPVEAEVHAARLAGPL